MKICRIIDESRSDLLIGFLYYFEQDKLFQIELSPDLTPDIAPISLDKYVAARQLSVDPAWSTRWVEQRIVPRDRQNLGSILRDNGLKSYDVFRLLMISSGRCAQDDCCVYPVNPAREALPAWLTDRRAVKTAFACTINDSTLLTITAGGSIIASDISQLALVQSGMEYLSSRPDLFAEASRCAGGSGVCWPGGTYVSAESIYSCGTVLPFKIDDVNNFLSKYAIDTQEAAKQLNCSRQYIAQLVKEGTLSPLSSNTNSRLYSQCTVNELRD